MTTVTPSDQAGATSAKRPATIPTQRSVQALRFLVLGTSDDAAAFRAHAAEAGAELAQRFSVRVTHVVVEAGVGEDDARVVRARGAGLPVLGLIEGTRLVEETASGVASETGTETEAGTGTGTEGETMAEVGSRGADGSMGETVIAADVVDIVAVDVAEAGGGAGAGSRTDVAEAVDDGTSDAFTGSAFEAMLQFPPLPAEEFERGDGGAGATMPDALVGGAEVANVEAAEAWVADAGVADAGMTTGAEAEATVGAVAEAVGAGVGEAPSALMDEVSAACACASACAETHDVGEVHGVGAVAGAAALVGASGDASGAVGVEVAGAAAGGELFRGELFEAVEEERANVAGAAASVAWALVPLVSLGLLTPVAIGYAAYRLRSRSLAAATACYSVAIVAAFAVSAALPVHTRAQSVVGDLMTTCLAAAWLGGTAHSFMLRRRVFGLSE